MEQLLKLPPAPARGDPGADERLPFGPLAAGDPQTLPYSFFVGGVGSRHGVFFASENHGYR
jgi:hypothetical protein